MPLHQIGRIASRLGQQPECRLLGLMGSQGVDGPNHSPQLLGTMKRYRPEVRHEPNFRSGYFQRLDDMVLVRTLTRGLPH